MAGWPRTLGYTTAGDGGGNVYRYDAADATVTDGGFVIDGPGSNGRYHAINRSVANVKKFGAAGDWVDPTGTDDADAIEAAADAAGTNSSLLYIPPGDYRIDRSIVIPSGVSVEMAGAHLYSTSTDYTQAAVTFGDGTASNNTMLNGLSVTHSSIGTHKFPAANLDRFAGIRLRNVGASKIYLGQIAGFNIGLQLFPDPGMNCGYNAVFGGSLQTNKVGIELRGNTSTGWVNENKFFGAAVNATSSIDPYGNVDGIKFTTEPGGYTSLNNNVFSGITFQVRDKSATYDWSASSAVTGGLRYFNAGNSYEVTNGDGTTGTDAPVHTSGAVTDNNGVEFTYRGVRRNTPVRFDGAGSFNKIDGARWETSYGPFMVATDPEISTNNRIEVYKHDDNLVGARSIDDYTAVTTAVIGSEWTNSIRAYGDEKREYASLSDLHLRAINSADGTVVAGMGWIQITAWTWSRTNANIAIICADYLKLGGGSKYLACLVPTRNVKRFLIHREAPTSTGARTWLKAYGAALNPLTVSDTDRSVIGGDVYFVHPNDALFQGSDSLGVRSFLVPDDAADTKYVAVALHSSSAISGLSIQAVQDSLASSGVASLSSPYGDNGRCASGTPTGGIFQAAGEFIGNVDTSTIDPVGWYVDTPGALAPAWVSSAAVIEGELRESSGKIYAAQSAGTTGATAPTGIGIDIDDDNILWDYFSEEASLSPLSPRGPAHGGLTIENNSLATTIASSSSDWSNKVQVNFDTISSTALNTTPSAANDDINVDLAGDYALQADLSVSGTAGDTISVGVFKNDGVVQLVSRATLTLTGNNDTISVHPYPAPLSVDDTVEVWIQNETAGRDVTVEDAHLSVYKIAP